MNTEAVAAHPVRTLRELATSLEAALLVCQASPVPEAVHRVRTRTRRIEAQLLLLAEIPHLPPHGNESRKVKERLKQLRRLAATIGDLDVQCQLVLAQSHSGTSVIANKLYLHLERKRERQTPALLHQLRRRSGRIGTALERLLAVLQPAEKTQLSATKLISFTQRWFARQHRSGSTNKNLHATRKAAKLARYMAECAPNSAKAKKVARAFEKIQQAGGRWHDWLQITRIAGERLRKKNPLVEAFRHKCEASARVYKDQLERSTNV